MLALVVKAARESMKRSTILFGIIFLAPLISLAEIEKVGQPCETGICLAWWPKLAPAKGWHHEREPSLANGANIQVPDGFTFSNAETVIYAKALYKPRTPETTSLEMLIRNDKERLLSSDPGIAIAEAPPLKTKDGKALKSFTFFPNGEGNWEQVTYGEDGDFYLLFTISSRSHAGFLASLKMYEEYIGRYKDGS
jgi:hypothetical protein